MTINVSALYPFSATEQVRGVQNRRPLRGHTKPRLRTEYLRRAAYQCDAYSLPSKLLLRENRVRPQTKKSRIHLGAGLVSHDACDEIL